MSLDSILKHILDEAGAKRDEIIREAQKETEALIQAAGAEAEALYKDIIIHTKQDCEKNRERLLVNARLEARKSLLCAKQTLVEEVFKRLKAGLKSDKFKRQQISEGKIKEAPEDLDFYLAKLRRDYETEIAGILFK